MEPEITLWQSPPSRLSLPDNELHLWRFELDTTVAASDSCRHILCAEEISRGERLLDGRKKAQFIAARTCLRTILGSYLQIQPNQVQFQYNQYGKPSLSEIHHTSLFFNLSHSGDWGVLAVVIKKAVGVDLEYIDPEMDFFPLSHRYFNEQEKLCLEQYPHSRQRRGFYRLWTQKEAMLKLLGSGFAVSPAIGAAAGTWHKIFPIFAEYLCTVAFDRKIERIRKFHFSAI
jgi:4'-phosphopantetheinyl transferase